MNMATGQGDLGEKGRIFGVIIIQLGYILSSNKINISGYIPEPNILPFLSVSVSNPLLKYPREKIFLNFMGDCVYTRDQTCDLSISPCCQGPSRPQHTGNPTTTDSWREIMLGLHANLCYLWRNLQNPCKVSTVCRCLHTTVFHNHGSLAWYLSKFSSTCRW